MEEIVSLLNDLIAGGKTEEVGVGYNFLGSKVSDYINTHPPT